MFVALTHDLVPPLDLVDSPPSPSLSLVLEFRGAAYELYTQHHEKWPTT